MNATDEQDAREFLQVVDEAGGRCGVAVRDVSRSSWRPVDPAVSS